MSTAARPTSHREATDTEATDTPATETPASDTPANDSGATDTWGPRLGWLVRAWRESRGADAAAYAEQLTAAGWPIDAGALAAYETGEQPPPYGLLRAVEDLAGLPERDLAGLAGYVHVFRRDGAPAWTRPEAAGPADLAGLVDAVLAAPPAEVDRLVPWARLADALTDEPHRAGEIDAATWDRLAAHCLGVLPRGVRGGHRTIARAMHLVCDLPPARDAVVRAIKTYLSDRSAQVLSMPIVVLDRIPTRESADLTLELLESDFLDRDFRIAVWVAAQKVQRGEFDDEQRVRLDLMLLKRWRSNSQATATDFAELIAALPEDLRATFAKAATQVGRREVTVALEHGEHLPAEMAAAASAAFARGVLVRAGRPVEPGADPDPVLRSMIREAMFHLASDRRHLASVLLSCSPYADAVASCALDLLDRDDVPQNVRAYAAHLVQYTATPAHRTRLARYLDHPADELVFPVVHALGHLPPSATTDQELRRHLPGEPTVRGRSCLYALGMTGSPALELLASSPTAPAWQRDGAAWWLRTGAGLPA